MVLLQGWRYHVVGGDSETVKMMDEACSISSGLSKAEIVIFTGGTDVNPSLYGEQRIQRTQRPDTDRDMVEQAVYHACVAKKKFLVGICRGAQFLNVMNGGRLWQHVDNHVGTCHPTLYVNERDEKYIVAVTSDHHQLMRPTADAHIWASSGGTTERVGYQTRTTMPEKHNGDPEIIWYRTTKSLCFQPHPEWGLVSCRQLFLDCIRRAMLGG